MSAIVSDSTCIYDPDGTWCYTHEIRDSEHDREIVLSEHQRSRVRDAIGGLMDEMMQRGFEWDQIDVRAVPIHWGGYGVEIRAYQSHVNGFPCKPRQFGVAVYMDASGRYEFDGA